MPFPKSISPTVNLDKITVSKSFPDYKKSDAPAIKTVKSGGGDGKTVVQRIGRAMMSFAESMPYSNFKGYSQMLEHEDAYSKMQQEAEQWKQKMAIEQDANDIERQRVSSDMQALYVDTRNTALQTIKSLFDSHSSDRKTLEKKLKMELPYWQSVLEGSPYGGDYLNNYVNKNYEAYFPPKEPLTPAQQKFGITANNLIGGGGGISSLLNLANPTLMTPQERLLNSIQSRGQAGR